MDRVPGVFWLGGGSGAGKSTVATAVARRLDLRLYAVDGHTYEHMERASAHPRKYPLTNELVTGLSAEHASRGTGGDGVPATCGGRAGHGARVALPGYKIAYDVR
jgi:hypothetical protein